MKKNRNNYELIERKLFSKKELLCETKLIRIERKVFELIGKKYCQKFYETFFNQFFVKYLDITIEKETKMTTIVPPKQTNRTKTKFQCRLQLSFL